MLKYNNYVLAESLEQAYELNQKKPNVILGGTGWLKMQDRQMGTAIDLSGLGLDTIEENDEEYRIGCMTTLRELETNKSFNAFTMGAAKESVRHIVGVQFRNCVTVGGSIFGRYGFSDVLALFLGLDSYVELYKGGIVPMAEFAKMPYDRDILVRVIVKKTKTAIAYQSLRNQTTDFPVLNCVVSKVADETRVVIGARPERAQVVVVSKDAPGYEAVCQAMIAENVKTGDNSKALTEDIMKFANWAADSFKYGSNIRGSAEYRKMIAATLVKRCVIELNEKPDM